MDARPVRTRVVRPASRWIWLVCGCACLSFGVGCATTGHQAGKPGGAASVSQSSWPNPFKKKKRTITDPEAGFNEYDAAVAAYDANNYEEAETKLKAILKKYEDYPVEEEARFLLAETYFVQKKYPRARDNYEALLKKFASTGHLEQSTRRLFAIGVVWLRGTEQPQASELVQVSAEDVKSRGATAPPASAHPYGLMPNLWDRSRPVFDADGFALKCFKSVWLYDPTGPLADDALMACAVYYVRKGKLMDADYYFDLLRQEYPRSEHSEKAFVLGSQVKLANYQGPRYDGRQLAEADHLVRSTLNLFPEIEERERLQEELKNIHERSAEREWERAQFYENKQKPQSAAIYYELLLKNYSDSEYAPLARERLQALGPKYWTGMIQDYPDVPEASAESSRSLVPMPRLWPFGSTPAASGEDEPQFVPQGGKVPARDEPGHINVDDLPQETSPGENLDGPELIPDNEVTAADFE